MFNLRGKVALVAGGAGYFGSSICRALSAQGAEIAVADIDTDGAGRLAHEASAPGSGKEFRVLRLDVADEASIQGVVRETCDIFGRLDILINATYRHSGKPFEDLGGVELDALLHMNVTGAFLLAREAAARMIEGGAMVFFSSMYGRVAPDPRIHEPPLAPNPLDYGMAKAALEQMTRYLAVQWASRKIRVNAIAPGAFPHAQQRKTYPRWMEQLAAKAPLGRIGKQDEVTGAVIYLVSDEASFMTGQVLVIDGGWTIW